MNQQELNEFREKLAALASAGTEADVRAHINAHFRRLPEEMRNEIVFNLFYTLVKDELRAREAIGQVQEEGLAAADFLKNAQQDEGDAAASDNLTDWNS